MRFEDESIILHIKKCFMILLKSCYLHMIPRYFIQLSHSGIWLQQIAFPDTWSLNFLIFLVFSWVKIVTGIFFWVLHLVCTVCIRRFVSKVHIMCIHRNDWFDKIMPHGRGHLGNNFEIAIPINRYPQNYTSAQDLYIIYRGKILEKKIKMLLYLICCDSK